MSEMAWTVLCTPLVMLKERTQLAQKFLEADCLMVQPPMNKCTHVLRNICVLLCFQCILMVNVKKMSLEYMGPSISYCVCLLLLTVTSTMRNCWIKSSQYVHKIVSTMLLYIILTQHYVLPIYNGWWEMQGRDTALWEKGWKYLIDPFVLMYLATLNI